MNSPNKTSPTPEVKLKADEQSFADHVAQSLLRLRRKSSGASFASFLREHNVSSVGPVKVEGRDTQDTQQLENNFRVQ